MIDRDEALIRAASRVGPEEGFVRVRCSEVLAGLAPTSHALEVLAERSDPARVVDAEEVLGVLDDLRALGTPAAEPPTAFLARVQGEDGSWTREAPDEGVLDDEATRILATAMIAGHLGKTRCVRPECLERAGDFLAPRWSPDRVQGFVWESVAAWAHFFANVPHSLSDEGLQWCGRELERGYRAGRFDAASCARVLIWCDGGALPGGRIDAPELIEAVTAQIEDAAAPDPKAANDPTPPNDLTRANDPTRANDRKRPNDLNGANPRSGSYEILLALARLP